MSVLKVSGKQSIFQSYIILLVVIRNSKGKEVCVVE